MFRSERLGFIGGGEMMGVCAVIVAGRMMMMRVRVFGRGGRLFGGGGGLRQLHLQHVAVMDGDREDERHHRHEGAGKGNASQAMFQPIVQRVMHEVGRDHSRERDDWLPATCPCDKQAQCGPREGELAAEAAKDHPAQMARQHAPSQSHSVQPRISR